MIWKIGEKRSASLIFFLASIMFVLEMSCSGSDPPDYKGFNSSRIELEGRSFFMYKYVSCCFRDEGILIERRLEILMFLAMCCAELYGRRSIIAR